MLFATESSAFPEYASAFALLCIGWFIQIYRWKRLVDSKDIRFSFFEACKVTWAGQFCSLFLPGVIGGELVRGYYISDRASAQRMNAVSTVILDRGFGLYASLWLGLISSLYYLLSIERSFNQVFLVGCFSGLALCGMHLMWHIIRYQDEGCWVKRLVPKRIAWKFADVGNVFKIPSRENLLGIVLSVVSSIFTILAFYTIGNALTPHIGWLPYFIVCPVVFISLSVPVAPGGIGVGEASAAILFSTFNIENGATMMLTFRVMNIILRLPGALFLVIIKRKQ